MPILLSAIVSFVVLAVPLWSQPPTTFVHDNRLRLVRQAPQVYRPAFGRLDSNAGASTLDSLLQRGFDPEVDIFGYDSSIVSFAGGTFLFRRAGRTELVVRYPVYPGYLDTVGVVVSRDNEGFDVTLRHRPVVAAIDTVTQRVRLRRMRRIPPVPAYIFQIYAGFVEGERRFFYQIVGSFNHYNIVGHELLVALLPFDWGRRLPLWRGVEHHGGVVEMQRDDWFSFTDYDSTIVRFDGEQVVPLRPGRTAVAILYHTGFTGEAIVEVDRSMVVSVVEDP